MAKNLKTFVGALPIIAKAIGRRYDVRVRIGGQQACTDGNMITLPALKTEDPEMETLVNGYLDHEAAHCRFTDFSVKRSRKKFQNWLEGVLEDIRIEAAMGNHYPGCKKHLAELEAKLVRDDVDKPVTASDPPPAVLTGYIYYQLRSAVLGQDSVTAYAKQAAQRLDETFPRGLCTKLNTLMGEVEGMQCTQDAIDLAARITEMLKEECEEPPQSPSEGEPGESDPEDGGDDGEHGQSEDGQAGDELRESEDGEGDDEPEESEDGEGDDDPEESEDGAGDEDPEDPEDDAGDDDPEESEDGAGDDDPEESEDGAGDDDPEGSEDDAGDEDPEESEDGAGDDDPEESEDGAGDDDPEESEDGAGDEDPEESEDGAGDDDPEESEDGAGDDDPEDSEDAKDRRQRLSDSLEGDEDEFKADIGSQVASELERNASSANTQEMAEPDDEFGGDGAGGEGAALTFGAVVDETAVRQASARLRNRLAGLIQTQTLDDSWHGRFGKRIDVKRLPRLRLGDNRVFRKEIDEPGVDTAVTVLLDRSGSMAGQQIVVARETALAMTYALEAIEGVNASVFAFPGAGDNNRSVFTLHRRGRRINADRFGIDVGGSTPLTEAAWYAGWDLLVAHEPRKILITVTDGGPNDMPSAIEVFERLRASGIETLGLGIGMDIDKRLMPENQTIGSVAELSTALFGLLERKLVTEVAA